MSKYKFILTLPYGVTVDSAEEIEGHVSWPNYSQAEPIRYRGVFDSYDEAKEYADNFTVYKFELSDGYDSFGQDDYCPYFVSIYDAEDAVCAYTGMNPGEPVCVHPDGYTVEEIKEAIPEKDIPAGIYKYCLHYDGNCVYDSVDSWEWGEYFDTYEEAREEAESYAKEYDVETDEYPCDWIHPIEILNIEIVEIEETEEEEED